MYSVATLNINTGCDSQYFHAGNIIPSILDIYGALGRGNHIPGILFCLSFIEHCEQQPVIEGCHSGSYEKW